MKILFITSGSIGDAIISTGLLGHLADKHPSCRFTIAAGPAAAPLFEAFPQLERLIVIQKKPWKRHWLMLWQATCRERWDMVVDLRGSLLSLLLRTKARKIFQNPDSLQPKSVQHSTLFDLPAPPRTRLWASVAARSNADALLPAGKKIILLAPKTNSTAKDWPIDRFAELAQVLAREEWCFVVLASAAQQESVRPLVHALPASQILDLSGKTDLLTAYAIMQRAVLFIGNDSGLLHMAAAAGIACVGLYGPSNDKTYAPQGQHVKIITARDFKPGEKEKRESGYMENITVHKVEETANILISRLEL